MIENELEIVIKLTTFIRWMGKKQQLDISILPLHPLNGTTEHLPPSSGELNNLVVTKRNSGEILALLASILEKI